MDKVFLLIVFVTLAACAAAPQHMQVEKAVASGMTIHNIPKGKKAKAFRMAEKHCAKYNKAAQTRQVIRTQEADEYQPELSTMIFSCLRATH